MSEPCFVARRDLERASARRELARPGDRRVADRDDRGNGHAALARRAVCGAHDGIGREARCRRRAGRPRGSSRRRAPARACRRPQPSCRCASRSASSRRRRSASIPGARGCASTASLSPCTTLNTPSGQSGVLRAVRPSRIDGDGSFSDGFRMKRVAARERDREHPQRHHRGEVERRDAGADADRLLKRIGVDVTADRSPRTRPSAGAARRWRTRPLRCRAAPSPSRRAAPCRAPR